MPLRMCPGSLRSGWRAARASGARYFRLSGLPAPRSLFSAGEHTSRELTLRPLGMSSDNETGSEARSMVVDEVLADTADADAAIGVPVRMAAGQLAGRTIRAELDEMQKADVGRKSVNALDPSYRFS